jgi:hypothetical protein
MSGFVTPFNFDGAGLVADQTVVDCGITKPDVLFSTASGQSVGSAAMPVTRVVSARAVP